MSEGNDNLWSVPAIQRRAKDLSCELGREGFFINSAPRGDGSPYIEVDDAYHFIVEERGVELERGTTSDLDELLFWIMRGLTASMAWDYELRNRREGEDSRRQAFAKDLEFLRLLSPAWAERQQAEYAEVLQTHPFHDA